MSNFKLHFHDVYPLSNMLAIKNKNGIIILIFLFLSFILQYNRMNRIDEKFAIAAGM